MSRRNKKQRRDKSRGRDRKRADSPNKSDRDKDEKRPSGISTLYKIHYFIKLAILHSSGLLDSYECNFDNLFL